AIRRAYAAAGPAEGPCSRLGPGNRAHLGLLLRAVWSASDALCGLAAELRPDSPRLLPGGVYGPGHGAFDSGATAVLVYAHGFLAGDISTRHPAESVGQTAQSVPAHSIAVSPP